MAKMITPAMKRINKKQAGKKNKKNSFIREAWSRLARNPTAIAGMCIVIFLMLVAIFADVIAPYDYIEMDYTSICQKPGPGHIFGTDNLGRDLFSRCVYGARYSLLIGLCCCVLALAGGGMLGLIAAFFGKRTDTIIMRIMDVFQAIPGVLMAITIVASLGTGIPQLLIAMTISFMPSMAKTVRAAIFTVRGHEYIDASRSIGASNLRLMFRHMLPNAVGHIIIFAVGSVSAGIMQVATLSYIGLGIQPPSPEWGALLNAGKGYISSYPHMVLYPGLCIMLTILGFNLFGDGLRDALDPRLK